MQAIQPLDVLSRRSLSADALSLDGAQLPDPEDPTSSRNALELDHAIQTEDPEALKAELGDDVLPTSRFQIVIAEERSHSTRKVVTRYLEKDVEAHPHLYAGAHGADHAKWRWSAPASPAPAENRGTLAGLPPTLPPLIARTVSRSAPRVSLRLARREGADGEGERGDREVEREAGAGRRDKLEEEIGTYCSPSVNLRAKLSVEAAPGARCERNCEIHGAIRERRETRRGARLGNGQGGS